MTNPPPAPAGPTLRQRRLMLLGALAVLVIVALAGVLRQPSPANNLATPTLPPAATLAPTAPAAPTTAPAATVPALAPTTSGPPGDTPRATLAAGQTPQVTPATGDTPAPPVATAPPTPAAVSTAATTAVPTSTADAAPFSPAATLAALANAQVPTRDLYTLTQQVKARTTAPLPRTSGAGPRTFKVGDREVFQVGDTANGAYYPVTATLQLVTPHVYWWVDDDHGLSAGDLQRSAERFESNIYPTNREAFGEPPDPGVDNDTHINVLNTPISGAAGYFSAADMYTQAVNPFSNQRKMIYAGYPPGGAPYEGLLAHEFQHMIHWNVHPRQNVWLNEGMAELAMKINGYDTGGPEVLFQRDPDVQLNSWASPPDAARPHYGAAYLFMNYLYSRFGAEMIHAIMQAPGADIDAVDAALAARGRSETFRSVFTDWALANWLDKTTQEARYQYPRLQVQVAPRSTLSSGSATYAGAVHQQAADYLVIPGSHGAGTLSVDFAGDATVPLIGVRPHSGRAFWWSNRGDVSAPALTRAFDLSAVKTATLSYWTWYDIEEDYDYAFAEVSTDNGQTWDTLAGPNTRDTNPNGNNLGHGYTGVSGRGDTPAWVQESLDLSAYAGKPILLRFQYVTDDGVNLQGFAVDDLRIPEIGYRDDAETPGAQGWTAEGFVHVDPVLPEAFSVVLISYAADGTPRVTPVALDAANHGQLTLAEGTTGRAVLLVAPLAPSTTELGHYRVSVTVK
ncbi:MAG TPA: hypothetical protein VM536_06185 [Chloroflexia bacterium]|nr:hypothetical protein [Chloroflexia bacterium]